MGEAGAQPVGEEPLERADVDPVVLELDGGDRGAALLEREQRPVVGRPFDDDRLAGADERVEEERVGLHRSVGGDHARRLHAVLLGDPLAERDVADRGAVGDGAARVLGERLLGRLAETVDVDDVERGSASGEGDRTVGGHALGG